MANSSSGGSSTSAPEIIYHYPTLGYYNSGSRDDSTANCQLCLQPRKLFYCVDCIRNGAFTHSKDKTLERFADKKLRAYKLNDKKSEILKRYEAAFSTKIKAETLKCHISAYSEKISLLKEHMKQRKKKLSEAEKCIEELQKEKEYQGIAIAERLKKIHLVQDILQKYESDMKKRRFRLEKVNASIKSLLQGHIKQLVIHVFPIKKIEKKKDGKGLSAAGQQMELEEAQQTMYVKGHWVFTEKSKDEIQYSIVDACIPGNGNYSAYTSWISRHNYNLPLTREEAYQRHLAYGIAAALTFTAQLVLVLTYFLDLQLPKRLCYSEFCGHDLNEPQFLHKVAKLNANVVHLCLSQHVNPELIHPRQTIYNLLLLLDPNCSDLTPCGPVEVNQSLLKWMEESLFKDLSLVDDDDEVEADWVEVSSVDEDEPLSYNTVTTEQSSIVQRYATSFTGNLMSSVSSIWRATTGKK